MKFKIQEDFSSYTNNPDQYLEDVKTSVAATLNCNPEDIIIRTVSPGSVNIEVIIKNFNEHNKGNNKLFSGSADELKKELSERLGKPIVVEEIIHEKGFTLSLDDFNPAYDKVFDGEKFTNYAGNKDYTQPPKGWTGKALKVKDEKGKWLQDGPEAWPIVYHGIGDPDFVLAKVLKEQLRPGHTNLCSDDVPSVYFSQHFQYAKTYSELSKSIKKLIVIL